MNNLTVHFEAVTTIAYVRGMVELLKLDTPEIETHLQRMEEDIAKLIAPEFNESEFKPDLHLLLAEILHTKHLMTNRLHEAKIYDISLS